MATKEDIKQEILDVIVLFTDPEWIAMTPRRKVQVALLEISECSAQVMGALDPDERDTMLPIFIEVAEELFDEYIEPIDLPVRDFIEGWVDSGLRNMIAPSIYNYSDWLEK
jgi:hypothetical protein